MITLSYINELKLDIEFYNWNGTGKKGTIQIYSVTVE